ncbi:hypothetical protein BJ165DRAFT_1614423 [Panaeolus papilionaceus]|nr:hypothetical protein BJ165DRAFT_1614423 [Panaeolus papilionaceus]
MKAATSSLPTLMPHNFLHPPPMPSVPRRDTTPKIYRLPSPFPQPHPILRQHPTTAFLAHRRHLGPPKRHEKQRKVLREMVQKE